MQYDEDALQEVRESRFLIDQYDAWIIDEFRPFLGQRILEVGCGLGNLVRHFLDRELVTGIETSAETVGAVKRQFANYSNLSFYQYDIADPSVLALRNLRFDSAVSLNVFEHIEDDETAMRHTAQLLQPDGRFILVVPAHLWLYGTMDRSIGHYRRYDKISARERLERTGFKVVYQKYMNSLGAMGWFVNGRLFRRRVPPSAQLRAINRILPMLRALEQAFPPFFGISLMTVAQRV